MLSKGKIPVILRKTKVSGTEWLNLRHVCISHSIISDSLRPYGLWPPRLLCPWDSAGKNTGVVCHFLLQGIFPTQGSNPHLYCTQILYHLSHQGSPVDSENSANSLTCLVAEMKCPLCTHRTYQWEGSPIPLMTKKETKRQRGKKYVKSNLLTMPFQKSLFFKIYLFDCSWS